MTKRLFDILVAGLSLLVLLLPGLAMMAILRLTGEGKVFYLQPRVGIGKKLFHVFKFVTMRVNSEHTGTGVITIKNDPRVLPVGRVLRKTKINELPQLINVLKGEMSMVGPRPLTQLGFDFYPAPLQDRIAQVKPGLTGIGSILFRDEESLLGASDKPVERVFREDIAPYKGALEVWYIENCNLWLDVKILLVTAWVVLRPHSQAYRRWFKDLPPRPAALGGTQPDASSSPA